MQPLIKLEDVSRTYVHGDEVLFALRDINLTIKAGEFIAIVGTSGSGKSTLLNILGCLDSPTSGCYRFSGQDVFSLDNSAISKLRCLHFGFVFQRYHLLADLDAISNVEVPAIYACQRRSYRRNRAIQLLCNLGLSDRLHHQPQQLSGGQQQRVSIARALMNEGEVILADEPTGALDIQSSTAVLNLLRQLNDQGHTIILVTHDRNVAETAKRVIEIRAGMIQVDRPNTRAICPKSVAQTPADYETRTGLVALARLLEVASIASRSIVSTPIQSILTILSIVIGIAAFVSVIGLGEGGRRKVLEQINNLGTNTIIIFPGRGWSDENRFIINSLTIADSYAIAKQPYLVNATPVSKITYKINYLNRDITIAINGIGNEYFSTTNRKLLIGRKFLTTNVNVATQEIIIDENALSTFFPNTLNPIGKILIIRDAAFRIVGVVEKLPGGTGQDIQPTVFIPIKSLFVRLSGDVRLTEIIVRLKETVSSISAEKAIVEFLRTRHGTQDFFTYNSDQVRRTIEATTRTISLLMKAVAAIALFVGGVGITNIMLVSVAQRKKEIGLRMAVGARPVDITLQFLTEALLLTLAGSSIGIALSAGLGSIAVQAGSPIPLLVSGEAVIIACCTALMLGLAFAVFPALKAASIDPVNELSRD